MQLIFNFKEIIVFNYYRKTVKTSHEKKFLNWNYIPQSICFNDRPR